jgi:hypothetical protein
MLGVAVKVGVTDVVALNVGDGVGVALALAMAINWPRLVPMYTD